MEATNLICDICNKRIHFGSPYIALCYNIEHMERDHVRQTDFVNVITSDQIITMCGKCGNKRNAAATKAVLENSFNLTHPRLN